MALQKTVRVPQEMDDLSPGDKMEHGITLEVDTGTGKAWIKYGVVSVMKASESPEQAVTRVVNHVERELEDLIERKS